MKPWWIAFLFLLLLIPSAEAETQGPCTVIVNDVNLASHDSNDADNSIRVARGQDVSYRLESDLPFRSYGARLRYGVGEIPFQGNATGDQTVVAGAIPANKFENLAGGLYHIELEATRNDGSTCTATALVFLDGGLVNAVTVAAVAMAIGGLWALISALLQVIAESKDYVNAVKDFREGRRMV